MNEYYFSGGARKRSKSKRKRSKSRSKGKRKISAYNRFVKQYFKSHKGTTMKQAAAAWRQGGKRSKSRGKKRRSRYRGKKRRSRSRGKRRQGGRGDTAALKAVLMQRLYGSF